MQITNILIWQIDSTLRNLELEENKVNVITGDSGKGKSSILAIIDYCLYPHHLMVYQKQMSIIL